MKQGIIPLLNSSTSKSSSSFVLVLVLDQGDASRTRTRTASLRTRTRRILGSSIPLLLAGALATVATLEAPAAPAADATRPPNVLLIVSEDNGPELGCYDDPYAPEFELYDLQADPNEFINLAGRPALKETQEGLWEALQQWQRATRDPLADPSLFAAFVKEQDAQRSLAYRKQKDFRWSYLSDWPAWMEAFP